MTKEALFLIILAILGGLIVASLALSVPTWKVIVCYVIADLFGLITFAAYRWVRS